MKIGINGIILMEKPAGIANLIIRTANYLVKTEEIIIYSNKELNQDVLKRLDEKIRICILPMRILPNKTTLWLFFRLSKYFKKDEIDLFWCPNPWGPPFISKKQKVLVTVHDFVCRDYRNTSGKIESMVSMPTIPTENNSSNFGIGYEYNISSNGTISVHIADNWWVFAPIQETISNPESID